MMRVGVVKLERKWVISRRVNQNNSYRKKIIGATGRFLFVLRGAYAEGQMQLTNELM
jgi:hypothetical protein